MLGNSHSVPGLPGPSVFGLEPPRGDFGDARYRVAFARTPEELDAVLRLRFDVFNLELNEGLRSSFATGRDEDVFDLTCHHLIVAERDSGEIVGTYRLQTSAMALAGAGFYSATEFDLAALPDWVLADAVELGRACIAREHRNTRVLFLLWKGLATYLIHARKRFLFGCCSLTSQDPGVGLRLEGQLEAQGHMHPEYRVPVRSGFECDEAGAALAVEDVKIPALFAIYLRYGARVVSGAAIDRSFKTIDYLVLCDVLDLDERSQRMFFGE